MKKSNFKSIIAGIFTLAVAGGVLAFSSFANDTVPTVTYVHSNTNGGQKITFENITYFTDSKTTKKYPNLFTDMVNLMPGDTVTQEILVKVKDIGSGTVTMYLKVNSESDDVTVQETEDFQKLLHNAALTVSQDNHVIAQGDLEAGVKLGEFTNESKSVKLTVNLAIPIGAGNEIANLGAAVPWVFTAEYDNSTEPKPGGNGGGYVTAENRNSTKKSADNSEIAILNKEDHVAYIFGYPDGTVKPNNNMTREEVAAVYYRLLTLESRNNFESEYNSFSDVDTSRWSHSEISMLANAGIISGYEDGTFKPTNAITRAEFATMAVQFDTSSLAGVNAFSDVSGHWAEEYINKAAALGWISGYGDGAFRPDEYITRAEVMTLVNKMLDRRVESIVSLLDGMKTFTDNMDTSAWYYFNIQEATNSHEYIKNADGSETWTKLYIVDMIY